jgi:copper(I)-binding protein
MRRYSLVLAAVAAALVHAASASAGADEVSIGHLLVSTFDTSESRLVAGPVMVGMIGPKDARRQHSPILLQAQMKMAPANPATFKVGNIVVEAPWVRATPAGAKVAAGYMKIINTGKEADRLIGGTIDHAGRFEVHEMTMVNNVMRMRPLPNGLEIKPGETVELKPGGYHIMGLDLQGGYMEGQTVKGTLKFEKAGTVDVEYRVSSIGAAQPPMSGMGGTKMH